MFASTKAALSFALPLGLPPAPGFRRPRRGGSAASLRASLRNDDAGEAPRPRGLGARKVAQQRKRKDANEVSEPNVQARQPLAATPPTSSSRAIGSAPGIPRDPVHELISQVRDSEGRIVAPADWRTWLRALAQAVPVLEAALVRTRPAAVDAPATPAERQALDLLHLLHELDRQRTAVMSPRLLSEWTRDRQAAAQRLAAAAALPRAVLADVPGLTRAAQACGDAVAGRVRAETLALRCGGATGRPERRQLLMREWMTLEAQGPGRLIQPLHAFVRTCACFTSEEALEHFVAQSMQECMREALKLQRPRDVRLSRVETDRLTSMLQTVGQGFSRLPGLTSRSVTVALGPFVRRNLADPPHWLTEQSRALALCVQGVCKGLGAHSEEAESAAVAQSLLGLCVDHWLSQDAVRSEDVEPLTRACSFLLRGSSDQITQQKAALLSQVATARNAAGHAMDSQHTAAWLFWMCTDPWTQQFDASPLLRALARLPLVQAVDLLGTVALHWGEDRVSELLRTLTSGAAGPDSADTARLALAWGLVQAEGGKEHLEAQFPSSMHSGRTAALCRQACQAAIAPAHLLTLKGPPVTTLRQLVQEAYQLLGPSGHLKPASELARVLELWSSDPPATWRAERVGMISALFVEAISHFRVADFVTAHACLQRDMKVLLSRPDSQQAGAAAKQAAKRFFEAIPAWVAWRLESAGPNPETRSMHAVELQSILRELLAELSCKPRSLLPFAHRILQNELEKLQELLEPPTLPGARAWLSS